MTTAIKLKWTAGTQQNGPVTRRCYRSACGRLEVVRVMLGGA